MTSKRSPENEPAFFTREVSRIIFARSERDGTGKSANTSEEQVKLFNELSVEELEKLVASGKFYELFPTPDDELNAKAEAAPWPKHLRNKPYELD
jgi:hypothetical protein